MISKMVDSLGSTAAPAAIFLLIVVVNAASALYMLDLNGKWMIQNKNMGYSLMGNVPGSVYTALLDNKNIQDPYYRKNDKVYKWIGRDDWTYSRPFTVSAEQLQLHSIRLVCEGLDTIATVTINNQTVGTSDNMFVRYSFDIKSALKAGINTVTISFMSAVKYAAQRAAGYPYMVPPICHFLSEHGECHRNMIRKEPCSFSWDWGPSFPTQGIWKNIYIQGYNTSVLRDVTAETIKNPDGSWQVVVEVFTEVMSGSPVTGHIEARLDNTTVSQSVPVSLTPGNSSVKTILSVPASTPVKEWWPNGYGSQTLYGLFVFFTSSDGQEMSATKIRIGFRTVELVQDYVSNDTTLGRSFYFRINGMPIFFKGSNWIPADSFLERVTRDRIYNYLKSAADVHMNAMRAWGGGVYESDEFYEVADELGIMIWQDFVFGCAMYPTDAPFLASVTQEVTTQVRRLKHHPSLIAWSGNNENEKALRQNWYLTDVNYTRYYNDYVKLYRDTVGKTVEAEDTSRPFIASSPSDGVLSLAQGWVAQNPGSELYGDIHDYRYMDPFYEASVYRVPRFASEYGLQSHSSYETYEKVYEEADMDYWSDLNTHRQHHPFGNEEMLAEIIMYFNVPNTKDNKQKFKDLIYLTQLVHAIGMRTETEHYRRWQNRLGSDGRGNTMGALYWMLADIWQAPTWASLEYEGKWKALHYFAQHFFAPTLISPYNDGDNLDVYIVVDEVPVMEKRHPVTKQLSFHPLQPFSIFNINSIKKYDAHNSVKNAINDVSPADALNSIEHLLRAAAPPTHNTAPQNLYILMYSWGSMTPLKTWTVPFQINTTAESVYRRNIDDMVTEAGCVRRQNCFLYFHLGDIDNGPTSWHPISTFKDAIGIPKASIQVTDVQQGVTADQFSVTVATNATAPFVWLEAYGVNGRFSDNAFLLVQAKKTVMFYAWETVDITTLKDSLTVKSLMDIYH